MRRIRSSWAASTSSMDRTGMPGSTGGYAKTPVASAALPVWSARAFSVPDAFDRRRPPRKLLRVRMIAGQVGVHAILVRAYHTRPAGMAGFSGGFRHQHGHFWSDPVDTVLCACVEFQSRSSWPCEAFGKPQTSPALYAQARRHALGVDYCLVRRRILWRRGIVSTRLASTGFFGGSWQPAQAAYAVAVPSQPI